VSQRVPFIKPKFPRPEVLAEDLKRIYANNYYSNNGPVYHEFKRQLEAYLGQNLHAAMVSNATLGLMLGMKAAFGETGDTGKRYVAVPSFTFSAGPLAIRWCGFEPIFFDIDPDTTQPSLASFRRLLEEYEDQLAGVLLVNNFGIGNEQIGEWERLLKEHNLPLVIDSAPGFGSAYADGALLGGRGMCEVFSFHATKPYGIGEGGLVTSKDPKITAMVESLKNFGFNDEKLTDVMGVNAKITELDCAIGLRILAGYADTLKDRRETYRYYEKSLQHQDIRFLPRAVTAAIQFTTIMVPAQKRPQVLSNLKEDDIEARTYYAPPVHVHPLFRSTPKVSLKHTEEISQQVVSLPLHPDMDRSTVDRICDIVMNSL